MGLLASPFGLDAGKTVGHSYLTNCFSRVGNAMARQLRRYKMHQLSNPAPHDVFEACWGASDAWRPFSLHERVNMLCRVAISGCLANLKTAVANAGCVVSVPLSTRLFVVPHREHPMEVVHVDLMAAAASAGHFHICAWLRENGCSWGAALPAAAREGRSSLCAWLLDNGCNWTMKAVRAAAAGGHVGLADWLLAQHPKPQHPTRYSAALAALLAGATEGCDLTTLRRLLHERVLGSQGLQPLSYDQSTDILAAAAGSPAPDWKAKVKELEGLGWHRSARACACAARCPDAVARLHWLHERGYPLHWLHERGYPLNSASGGCTTQTWQRKADGLGVAEEYVLYHAAAAGNETAVSYLLDNKDSQPEAVRHAAAHIAAQYGRLPVLRTLHAHGGLPVDLARITQAAAEGGHTAVVEWLVRKRGAVLDAATAAAAARSGSLELMLFVQEKGGRWAPTAVTAAADGGCQAALEWLLHQGCSMPTDGQPYIAAARQGDLSTLASLRRRGCPWGEPQSAHRFLVVPQAVVDWLVDTGCPWAADPLDSTSEPTLRSSSGRSSVTSTSSEERQQQQQHEAKQGREEQAERQRSFIKSFTSAVKKAVTTL